MGCAGRQSTPSPLWLRSVAQTVELLKQAKPLFDSSGTLALAMVGAFGAIGGALAAFFPSYWQARLQERQLKRSVALQLYSEIKAMLQLERHRGYIASLREIVGRFDRGEINSACYQVQVNADRFLIYKANLPHLGKLDPSLQQKTVLLYQFAEAAVPDIQPGGLLNATQVGRKPFAELLEILVSARQLGDEVMAQIEAEYPTVN
jgi:hypothetical protein